uniref:Tyrosine 3-monooxygenase n=1 Tax=Latimeria chalumnae TaxID=7897 RepID=H3AW11_LATCH
GRTTLTLVFILKNTKTAGLSRTVKVFENLEARIHHIETRPARKSKNSAEDLEFFVRCEVHNSDSNLLVSSLKRVVDDVKTSREEEAVPWFPKQLKDLDKCHHLITKFDPDLDHDHPGYSDSEYRKRRSFISDLAFNFREGELVPRVEYTSQEVATWKEVYRKLTSLYPTHACKQYLDAFQLLEKDCGYGEDSIPQLQDVSSFLKERTGFQLRPVAGLVSARDFLASLAFRVFQCTQYVRHFSSPMHSPEPDCCHELLGHIPMLADKEFAQFSQLVLLKVAGISEKKKRKKAQLQYYCVAIVLSHTNNLYLVFIQDSGLINIFYKENQMYALSNEPDYKPFDPEVTVNQSYQDQTYQPVYFVSESFEDAKSKLRQYASRIKKPFSVRYDPFTCSIEVLDKPQKVKRALNEMKEELRNLCFALEKLS